MDQLSDFDDVSWVMPIDNNQSNNWSHGAEGVVRIILTHCLIQITMSWETFFFLSLLLAHLIEPLSGFNNIARFCVRSSSRNQVPRPRIVLILWNTRCSDPRTWTKPTFVVILDVKAELGNYIGSDEWECDIAAGLYCLTQLICRLFEWKIIPREFHSLW